MLKSLKLINIGPAKTMNLDLGERLNIFTGDNGLGKSFILDIAWWALTRKWPGEINAKLTAGRKAIPNGAGEASISFSFVAKSKEEKYKSSFQRKEQAWTGRAGRPSNPGLVLYAMSDGSFALWDPARNYWRTQNNVDVQDRRPAYVFTPTEVWDGLAGPENTSLCNGLLRDWANWQREKGSSFNLLCSVLEQLSPSPNEILKPGDLTRISLDDVRDMPTLLMPYQQDVPVVHCSSAMRRILALAYILIWAWEEHQRAAKLLEGQAAQQIIFLVDEIESHLNPKWQRNIVPAILKVVDALMPHAQVQLLATTHSPLLLASVEPFFDDKRDAWFDFDLKGKEVIFNRRDFEKHGDAAGWLISEAFDLKSGRAPTYEALVEKAATLLEAEQADIPKIRDMNQRLLEALSPKDDFLFAWQYALRQKGWL